MSEQPKGQDMLARLAEAFADQAVPPGPSEAVKERVKAALAQRSTVERPIRTSFFKTWRGSTMQKVMSLAAVLAFVAVGALVVMHPGGSGSAFAAMVDRMNEIRTVRFEMRSVLNDAIHPLDMHATVTLAKPWTRFEVDAVGQKVIRIGNSESGKMLMLFETLKTAQRGTVSGDESGIKVNDFVERFRRMKDRGAEFLGKESVGGIEALKYQLNFEGDYHTIWIDPATDLPLQTTVADTTEPTATTDVTTFSKFQWNVSVDPSELSLEVPAGYQMTPDAEK